MLHYFGSWKDWAEDILYSLSWSDVRRDGFPEIKGASILFDITDITGSCQSDWARVLYRKDCETFDYRQHFENLFYSAPVYIVLTVDGEEYHLHECDYEYEKRDVIQSAKDQSLPAAAVEFLESKLPEYP